MGYSDAEISGLMESFPSTVIDYLRDFRFQEVRDIIETLLYIYVAQNSASSRGEGEGVIEQSCYAYTSGYFSDIGSSVPPGTGRLSGRPPRARRRADCSSEARDWYPGSARRTRDRPVLLAGTVGFVNKTFHQHTPQ